MTASVATATSVPALTSRAGPNWRAAARISGLGAIVALYLCLVGIVVTFDVRPLIDRRRVAGRGDPGIDLARRWLSGR